MSKKIVVAVGGNSIIRQGEDPTVYSQFANSRNALKPIVELVRLGHKVVITHGNGPQVGNIMIRSDKAAGEAYELPVGVAVAQSQGEMGYMLAQCMKNMLVRGGILNRDVVAVVTQVLTSPDDPALKDPSKPVGPFMTESRAMQLRDFGIPVREDAGRGWRRVVPSPVPTSVVERESIRVLYEAGLIVVAVGGGGCPIYIEKDGTLEGIDAVVDKDLASKVLALQIGAEELIISTGIPRVCINFNKPNQQEISSAPVSKFKQWLDEGHFAPGSMKPKIRAAIEFIENGGKRVVISLPEQLLDAFYGNAGTQILPD